MRLSEVQELPMGYYFRPFPSDLIQSFLIPKLRGEELPVGELSKMHLRDLDVYAYEPGELPLNQLKYAIKNEGYFFVRDHKTASQIRDTPNGYWKIYKENVTVYAQDDGVVGFKNKLEYYSGKTPHEHKTDWRMIEFMAHESPLVAYTYDKDSYIVCKVKQKQIKDEGVWVEEEWEEEEEIECPEKEIGYSEGSNGDNSKTFKYSKI